MTTPNTHLQINEALCGRPSSLGEGTATVSLTTTPEMRADAQGLVHGGFVFGLADYAAMLAVNDPNVVLGSAEVRLTAPVRVGDIVTATATRVEQKKRKHVLEVSAKTERGEVFQGTMTAFVLDQHVLEGK